jgi:hypothetical protein
MSLTKHTYPHAIRAARRVLAPFEPRSGGDLGLRRRLARMFKELSAVVETTETASTLGCVRPRVTLQPPSPGFHHPAGNKHILGFIERLGPVARYGLIDQPFS